MNQNWNHTNRLAAGLELEVSIQRPTEIISRHVRGQKRGLALVVYLSTTTRFSWLRDFSDSMDIMPINSSCQHLKQNSFELRAESDEIVVHRGPFPLNLAGEKGSS